MEPGFLCNTALAIFLGIAGCEKEPPAAEPPAIAGPSAPGASTPPGDSEILQGTAAASRLAARATFGLSEDAIAAAYRQGEAAWLDAQFLRPPTYHSPVVQQLLDREASGDFAALVDEDDNFQALFGRMAWWHTTMTADDVVRQRVAYALSQIFVISDNLDLLLVYPFATSDYYDMLLEHAFGNFRDLLLAVTLHPAMGLYLSHLNNAKADPEGNTFPDENYAREVMQLFSIGLYELEKDGTRRAGPDGGPLPSYDNSDIREFARVFTGLTWGGANTRFGAERPFFRAPMKMVDEFHDRGPKTLLRGVTLPAGQAGMADIEGAVDNLFRHPNTGPFIGRLLIQRLVTSNPSPGYVERVASAFNGETGSPRGDMKAVLRAILLDPEARARPGVDLNRGKLREPLLRIVAALRQLGIHSPDGFYANAGFYVQQQIQQHPLSAPSVFNFYLPDYQPTGSVAEAGLVAPEFQITHASSIVALSNLLHAAILGDFVNDLREPPFSAASLDLDPWIARAHDVPALVDDLDLLFTYGTLSEQTRRTIVEAAGQIDDIELRTRFAIYLILISPDYAVEL